MTKLAGDHVQVFVDGYDLTGDSNLITVTDIRDMYDVTAFQADVHTFVGGQRGVIVEHGGYMNVLDARSHPALKGADLQGVVSVILGQNATPVAGDPMYSVPIIQGQYKTALTRGGFVPFGARFAPTRATWVVGV